MVIGCHVHIWIPGMVPKAYEDGCILTMAYAAGRALGQKFDFAQAQEMLYSMLQDEKGEKYLAHMDEGGIERRSSSATISARISGSRRYRSSR
ncbi:MAG: hypothetical protein SWK76_04645 [Actinomycetota bacterium]|nr:hypothetical protein [Actinomycetota bacterium]